MDAVLINSKGFGGNNATASILAPHITQKMLEKKHGKDRMKAYAQRNEAVQENSHRYDAAATAGEIGPIYRFDHNVLDGDALEMSQSQLQVKGAQKAIDLRVPNYYADMCD